MGIICNRQASLLMNWRRNESRSYENWGFRSPNHCVLSAWHVLLSSAQLSHSRVRLFVTPWTPHQASLSITNSRSPPKPMSIEPVMLSNHRILRRPLLLPPSIFPSIRVFSSESALRIGWPKYGVSTSASVLPMNIRMWWARIKCLLDQLIIEKLQMSSHEMSSNQHLWWLWIFLRFKMWQLCHINFQTKM